MAEEEAKLDVGPDQMQLARERTFLAYERTLMAWIRTATLLIGLGFALYKFFLLHEQEQGRHEEHILGPRTYGLIMMGLGVITLALAAGQYHQLTRRLRAGYAGAPFSLSLVLAALIAAVGILGFIAAIFRQ